MSWIAYDDGFIHFVADNLADPRFSEVSFAHSLNPPFRLLHVFHFQLTQHRFDARDVFFDLFHPHGVFQLVDGVLEAQVEKLGFERRSAFRSIRHCVNSRISEAFITLHPPLLPFLLQRTLHLIGSLWLARRICLAGQLLRNAADFKHHSARFYNGNPVFGRTFTRTHSGFSRFLSNRFIREDLNPYLTATFDVTGHGNTGRLNLVGSRSKRVPVPGGHNRRKSRYCLLLLYRSGVLCEPCGILLFSAEALVFCLLPYEAAFCHRARTSPV